MRRKKRKKRLLIITSAALVLLLFAVGCTVLLIQKKSGAKAQKEPEKANATPQELLAQYYTYIGEQKYQEMYQMLDEESRAAISFDDFLSRNRNIYEGMEAENITVSVTDTDESRDDGVILLYEVTMDTLAGQISFFNQTLFLPGQEKPSQYAVSWNDRMIHPELTSTDKIQVSSSEAKRGSLLDRNGKILAGEGTASSVGLVPGKMNENSSGDIQALAEILGVTPDSIEKKLAARWVKSDSFVPVKTVEKLTELEKQSGETSEKIRQKTARNAALLEIPGVLIQDITIRQYPLGTKGSHLTGYIQKVTAEDLEKHPHEGYNGNSMIGRSGMESLYEKELKGQNGAEIAIIDSGGQTKSILAGAPKQDGQDIRLTIDSDLQQLLYDQFSEDRSCSVAMNPYTGEVLALVSTPSFDSNDFIYGMSSDMWNALNEDEAKPLYNRFRQKLCPGSSLKPVTAAIGLDTGAIDPEQDYGNEGLSWQKDKSWGNYYVTTLHAYEPATLENALIYSDNIYFAKAALNIGTEKLQSGLDALGFNQELPFEISVANSQYSNTEHIESEIQLADSGYGQGQVLVNPIHLAALYTGFANQGNVLKPYLLYQEETGKEIWLESAWQPSHAELVKNAMVQAVASEHGTGHGIYRSDIPLAGKTGTAEIKLTKEDQNGTELGWFGVFTSDPNAEKPILLLSMVEDVKDRGGSAYVVEKEKQVLNAWFGGAE